MKSGSYVAIIVIAGFVLVGYLFFVTPSTAGTQVPLVLAAVGGIVTLLLKQGETDAKVEKATSVSKENAQTLASVSDQVDSNTTATKQGLAISTDTHRAVNSRMDGLIAKVEELAEVQKKLIGAQQLARGIEIGREQATQGHAETGIDRIATAIESVVPPKDDP